MYEICTVCWWEDDGQNDENADRVHGGPNGRYSLSEARANFEDHEHMYDLGDGIEVVENPSPQRRNLVQYIREIKGGKALDTKTLIQLMDDDA